MRKQIAQGKLDPLYLIVGDDDAEMSRLAADLAAVVEDELRAFNFERLYAGEKAASPEAIVQSARTLPMMGDRRVIVVLRAEKISQAQTARQGARKRSSREPGDATADLDVLEAYVRSPEPMTTVVFVAADVDRCRRLYKAVQKTATIVECWGLKRGKDTKGLDLQQVARQAEALVKQAVTEAGKQIDAGRVPAGRRARRRRHRRAPWRPRATAAVRRWQADRSASKTSRLS